MPFTVITLKNVPPSLRGDLSKWMQEIATGVYIGNFNTRIREQLWERVSENVKSGEATISYTSRNELGYQFETLNSSRIYCDFDGLPLVMLADGPAKGVGDRSGEAPKYGFSRAAKTHAARKFSGAKVRSKDPSGYVVIDIETDGLDYSQNSMIEIGAVKMTEEGKVEFHELIKTGKKLPESIVNLTGITDRLLEEEGNERSDVLQRFKEFVEDKPLVGYNVDFDRKFILHELELEGLETVTNDMHDLMRFVKNEKMFLDNYKLPSVLRAYHINAEVPHRALLDARLICQLSCKVNKFREFIGRK